MVTLQMQHRQYQSPSDDSDLPMGTNARVGDAAGVLGRVYTAKSEFAVRDRRSVRRLEQDGYRVDGDGALRVEAILIAHPTSADASALSLNAARYQSAV